MCEVVDDARLIFTIDVPWGKPAMPCLGRCQPHYQMAGRFWASLPPQVHRS